jgi:hypothetical protein
MTMTRPARTSPRRVVAVAAAALVAMLGGGLTAAPAAAADTLAAPVVESIDGTAVTLAWPAMADVASYAIVEYDGENETGVFTLDGDDQERATPVSSSDGLVRAVFDGLDADLPRSAAIRGLGEDGSARAETARTAPLVPAAPDAAGADGGDDGGDVGGDDGDGGDGGDAGGGGDGGDAGDAGGDSDSATDGDPDVDAGAGSGGDADSGGAAGDGGAGTVGDTEGDGVGGEGDGGGGDGGGGDGSGDGDGNGTDGDGNGTEGDAQQVSGVLFDWGLNDETNGGSYFGGCNFLSAGVAGNTGSARVWNASDGFYRAEDGNTTIVRPTADGTGLTTPTWASRCQTPSGQTVNGKTTSSVESHTQTRVQIAGGTGTVDPVTGTADIAWEGSFTVAYYGGMTYWSASDPHLVVRADGTGELTATLSGYGADMDDTSIWSPLPGRTVPLARLSGVEVTASGVVVTPDYLGVSIPADIAGRNPQAARTIENAAWWGAFPAEFLRFQELTGQNSYWYTTDGGATSLQPRKVPLPLTVQLGATTPEPVAPAITSQPQSVSVGAGATASFTVGASGRPLRYQWQTHDADAGWTSIDGATAASHSVSASAALDGTRYRVIVSNHLASVASRAATLTVSSGSTDPGGGDDDESGPTETAGALFDWGINAESSGGSYFGGCNFLSAGVAGDTGSARVWAQGDGFYRTVAGNSTIVRPSGDGLERPSWATRCETADGTSVNGRTTSADDSHTGTRIRITGGTGTFDAEANTAEVSWKGSFTVAYYGGMTYWSASDPELVVRADGTGTLTATLSGYASDMDDVSAWGRVAPRKVVLATLTGVEVTPQGFTHTPDYLGVSIPDDIAGRNAQPPRTAENRDWWGSFPADFVRFQALTGQSSYWYTTPGGAGTIQPRKVPLPVTVCATSTCTVPEPATAAAGSGSPTIRQTALQPPTVRRWIAAEQVPLPPQTVTEVLIIKRVAAAPAAATSLVALDERVLVAAGALVALLGLLVLVAGAGGVLVLSGSPPRRP